MRRSLLFSVAALLFAGAVHATTEADIQFPIAELGGCQNENACFAYCEQPAHFETCYAFGTAHGLIEEEVSLEVIEALAEGDGPGGCNSHVACEAYCSDVSHITECVAFAEENDLMDEEELEEAKKVAAAVQAGAQLPGGCTSKDACEAYCEDASHMEECLNFAEAAGFISPEEIEEARKILPLMQSGQMPGGCTSKDECEDYCESGEHLDECMDFAVKAGFMTQEEAEEIKAFGEMMPPEGFEDEEFGEDGFSGPGGCTSPEECMSYCQAHPEECGAMMGAFESPEGFEPPEGFEIPDGFEIPEEFEPPEDFEMPEGCSSPEECMKLYGGSEKYEGDEGYTGYEGYLDSEGFGKDETHQDPRDFEGIEPPFEMTPDSLFITPPSESPSFESPSFDAPSFEGGGEPHSLISQPNATFTESVKSFFQNVLSQ